MDEELTQNNVKSTENSYKIKLLKLWKLLRQETDSRHPMITRDIIARLEEMGIGSERRTLAKDIETLIQYGYEIKSTNVSHSKGYYVDNAEFSTAELRILLDAVQSASFITKEKTAALIEKIAAAGGSHRRSLLEKNIASCAYAS